MSQARVCVLCKAEKPLVDFGRWRPTTCRSCVRAIKREYYTRNRERMLADRWAYRQANPEKKRAHYEVKRALAAGLLIRPDRCEECAETCSPHAHHDDYERPLAVRWLCTVCHTAVHTYAKAA